MMTRKNWYAQRVSEGYFLYPSSDEVIAILDHVREGCGVRQTGRLVGVSKNTANRYVLLAGQHAQALHDEVMASSPSDP